MKKILIVDDDFDIVKLLGERLKRNGYEVVAAFDFVTALTQAQRERPDLILLDLKMPAGSGLQVCKELKGSSHTCLTPVIVMTAFPSSELKEKAFEIGVQDFVTKPFDFEDLLAKIKRRLGESSET